MAGQTDAAKLNWPRLQQALLIALLVLVIGNRLIMLVDIAAERTGLFGQTALQGAFLVNDPGAEAGFAKAVDVTPDGGLAKAGVREGDHVRFERSYERLRRGLIGEKLDFTLDHDGVRTNRLLTLEPIQWNEARKGLNFQVLLNVLAALISLLIGCFILWRGWGNKTAMLLGAALLAQGLNIIILPPWAGTPILAIPMWSLVMVGGALGTLVIPFAMRMYEENVGPLPRRHWQGMKVLLILVASVYLVFGWNYFTVTNHLAWVGGVNSVFGIGEIIFLASFAYLIAGWRRTTAAARNRFALIAFALAAYHLTGLVLAWAIYVRGHFFNTMESGWPILFNALMVGVIAPGLLAYAVLRQKLFDFSFVVNRTLVFGTISAVLLVSFGTLEWAVEHLVPEAWHEGSAFFSAGIAVGLFLLFHRIRDAVEHVIERLFFRSWHANEAALKRFVKAAAHVEKPAALSDNFATELARFTGGAAAATYARTADGAYASSAGGPIDADDPALAAMRAEQSAVVPAEVHSSLPAALALPMMHQASLAGFALLGQKPTGEDYRPDEIEVLGWAVQQIGLDLQAIRVRDLELANVRLAERNQTLTELLAARQAPA